MAVQQGTEFLVLSHAHIGQFSLAGWTKAKHKVGFFGCRGGDRTNASVYVL
jgi:hypothetical protein